MRAALAFLTVVGGARPPDRRAVPWFPVVGALVGAAVGGAWWLAGRWWPAGVAAALAVVVDLVLTGAIHFDGLADAADGLLPHVARSRRLEVMASPETGAFAIVVVLAVLLLRWSALASQPPVWTAVAGLWALSRWMMAMAVRVLPSARPGGLAESFTPVSVAVVPLAFGAVALLLVDETLVRAVVALTVATLSGVAVLALAHRRLGGYTGDVLGAAGVIAETAGLLVLAAR